MEHKELHEGFHRVGENDETNIKKEQRLYIYILNSEIDMGWGKEDFQ